MVIVVSNRFSKHYGDLELDDECLFAIRGGNKVHFTRNERAVLLALSRNPNRLLTRSRLLDEIAADEDRSDRYIDFLVNRLRSKLGDDPKSHAFIKTRYGEGYVWVAVPTVSAPIEAFLAIMVSSVSYGEPVGRNVSALIGTLHENISASVSPEKVTVVRGDPGTAPQGKQAYLLHLNVQAHGDVPRCVVTLRNMPSRRIMVSFYVDLPALGGSDCSVEAKAITDAVLRELPSSLGRGPKGLGLTPGESSKAGQQEASIVLLGANPRWASGPQLAKGRAQDPRDADLALQWCLHLFSRLTIAIPWESLDLAERQSIENEIETTVLEHLPAAEDNPLLMFAAAKLLYYIDRGHIELAEDLADRALARTSDPTASFALMGQLRCARGRFDEALHFFDQGARRLDLGRDFQLHIRAMTCVALLAAGRYAELATTLSQVDTAPPCPAHIASMMDWTFAPHERPLSAASAKALAEIGPTGAANAITYSWFTSVRQIVSAEARANVLRGLIAQVTRVHGAQAVPAFVSRIAGMNAAA